MLQPTSRNKIASALSQAYGELASSNSPRFSLRNLLNQLLELQGLEPGTIEYEECRAAADHAEKPFNRAKPLLPWSRLARRDLTAASATGGGYLVGTQTQSARDVMRDWSITASAGVTIVDGLKGNVAYPMVNTALTAAWQSAEGATMAASDPVFGTGAMTPKHAAGRTKFSRQLLLQSSADEVISNQCAEAAFALLDRAIINGSGASGEPLGILNTSGVGTQSGTSLAHSGLRTMRKAVLDAGGREDRLAWIGATNVQDTLGGRELATGGGRFLWDDGTILGRPAHATALALAGSLVLGDWSRVIVGLWTGVQLELDPITDFSSGKIGARLVVTTDVLLSPKTAFAISTSIT